MGVSPVSSQPVMRPLKEVLVLLFAFFNMNNDAESSLQLHESVGPNTAVSMLNLFCTCSAPSCLSFWWQFIIMRQLSSRSGDNTIGCRLENRISVLLIQPPTRTISSPSSKEGRDARLTFIWDVLVSLAISRGKYSTWAVPIQNFLAHSNSFTKDGPIWRPVLRHLQL